MVNNHIRMFDRFELAAYLGIKPDSVSRMVSRGDIPRPDYSSGPRPFWSHELISNWLPTRPGRGKGGGRPRKAT